MGEAVTQAGAISVAAAFFREQLDARASANERPSSPSPQRLYQTHSSRSPSLRFPLGACHEEHALVSTSASGARELVVSRGPGLEFSKIERRICARAAELLDQALFRIRLQGALVETKAALESSLRGMEEASRAVAVMVGEKKQRAEMHEQARAELVKDHERAVLTANEELRRLREEVSNLHRRLEDMEQSFIEVARAANNLCRVVAVEGTVARRDVDCVRREGTPGNKGFGQGNEREMITLVEDTARKALRCTFVRVEQISEPNFPTASTGVERDGGREVDGLSVSGRCANTIEEILATDCTGETLPIPSLRVTVPQSDTGEKLVLSLRREDRAGVFGNGDKAVAYALAACLRTAIIASRGRWKVRELKEQAESDRGVHREREQAAETAAAAKAAEMQRRAQRAVTGMKAVISAARDLKVRAESSSAAVRRAEGQMKALRYLVAGLYSAGCDHAAVAAVVAERAAAVVPSCERAVLLTRRERCYEGLPTVSGDGESGFWFSPDPRAWESAARGERNKARGDEGGAINGWAAEIERAAAKAIATGNTICVCNRADVPTCAGASRRIVCFSPLPRPVMRLQPGERHRYEYRKENVSSTSADPVEWVEQSRSDAGGRPPSDSAIAWMLCLDDVNGSGSVRLKPEEAYRPPPVLPKGITTVIEGVRIAVGLALSGESARKACAEITARFKERRDHDAKLRREEKSRDAELDRLRRGTSALAARVQTLERKAAELRANEARSSSALARAQADAMAAKGELVLVMLERDRLIRRLDDWREGERKQSQELKEMKAKSPPKMRPLRDTLGDGFRHNVLSSAGAATGTTLFVSNPFSAEPLGAGSTLRWGREGDGLKEASSTKSVKDGHVDCHTGRGQNNLATEERSASQEVGTDASTSEALRHMASLHARLSDSLRRGYAGTVAARVESAMAR